VGCFTKTLSNLMDRLRTRFIALNGRGKRSELSHLSRVLEWPHFHLTETHRHRRR